MHQHTRTDLHEERHIPNLSPPPTHSLSHSLLTLSLTHSLTHALAHALAHSLAHTLVQCRWASVHRIVTDHKLFHKQNAAPSVGLTVVPLLYASHAQRFTFLPGATDAASRLHTLNLEPLLLLLPERLHCIAPDGLNPCSAAPPLTTTSSTSTIVPSLSTCSFHTPPPAPARTSFAPSCTLFASNGRVSSHTDSGSRVGVFDSQMSSTVNPPPPPSVAGTAAVRPLRPALSAAVPPWPALSAVYE